MSVGHLWLLEFGVLVFVEGSGPRRWGARALTTAPSLHPHSENMASFSKTREELLVACDEGIIEGRN